MTSGRVAPAHAAPDRARHMAGLGVLSLVGLALDQVTKGWAQERLRGRPFETVVSGLFELRYALNRGAFYGIGQDLSPAFRSTILGAAATFALLLALGMFARTAAHQRRLRLALCLLWTGGAGNLIDRVRRGEVIDFLHLHLWDVFHWATFNFADIYITAGLGLLAIELVRPQRPPQEAPQA